MSSIDYHRTRTYMNLRWKRWSPHFGCLIFSLYRDINDVSRFDSTWYRLLANLAWATRATKWVSLQLRWCLPRCLESSHLTTRQRRLYVSVYAISDLSAHLTVPPNSLCHVNWFRLWGNRRAKGAASMTGRLASGLILKSRPCERAVCAIRRYEVCQTSDGRHDLRWLNGTQQPFRKFTNSGGFAFQVSKFDIIENVFLNSGIIRHKYLSKFPDPFMILWNVQLYILHPFCHKWRYSRSSTRQNGHEIAFFSCLLWDHQFWARKKINLLIEKSVYAYLVIMLSNVYDSVGDIRSWKVLNIEK